MDHTPKNSLLRAVKRKHAAENADEKQRQSVRLAETLHVHTTLQKLLEGEQD